MDAELAQAAHVGFPPDDYRFRMIHDALAAICEDASKDETLDSLRKRGLEWADTDISRYADYFRQWFASNAARTRYVDEGVEKRGWPKGGSSKCWPWVNCESAKRFMAKFWSSWPPWPAGQRPANEREPLREVRGAGPRHRVLQATVLPFQCF